MKTAIWIVGIAALAVALTLAARYNSGYALFVLPSYRIELSLNLLLVLAAAAFAIGYVVVRAVSAALVLPRRVREYRLARRREKARSALLEALHEYFAGRYGRAEKAAAVSLEAGEQPVLSAVLAARAAHQLRAHERRDGYLATAASAPDEQLARLVTEAELLLDDRRPQKALDLLRQLPRRHSAALKLELRAQQQLRNWEQVLELTEELRKRNAFDATQAEHVRRHALAENLKRKLLDSHALEETWNRLAAADRTDRRVAAAAAQCFIALGGSVQAHRIIEQALEAQWDGELVRLYAESGAGDTVARIQRAEAWLGSHPRDAALLLTLGRLCAEQELWGKAQSYLEASIAIEPTHTAHLAAARLQETLGNAEAARRHYREALDLALAQLHEVTGGRRRTPL
jgi:HemY protein